MELLQQTWAYAVENQDAFWVALRIHLQLSATALTVALLICIPLSIWLARNVHIADAVLSVVNALRVVPSLAILFLAYPYLGLGADSALLALIVLACPPILINSYAAFRGVNQAVIESARGMGMNSWQILRQIEFPLAMPVIMTGVRTATVEVISSASLAAYISAGGLGNFILRGFSVNRPYVMLVGAIPIAFLALLSEIVLSALQKRLTAPS
jgi:osmoprotectant transport system permease protein